jgi:hypothetical protein
MDIYREVHGEEAKIPAEMEEQKAGVFKELEELREGQMKLDDLCRNEDLRVSSTVVPCGQPSNVNMSCAMSRV